MTQTTNQPILSVIIPVFNTEQYLKKCLTSIVNQSLKNIEVIISNDMSTDNSEGVILDFIKPYDFIKFVRMTAKGFTGGARNLALSKASGKYIGFVDSDDWIDSRMYEKMIDTIEATNADIAVCGVMTEYGHPKKSVTRYEYRHEQVLTGNQALHLMVRKNTTHDSISPIVCNKIYSAEFLKKNHFSFLVNNVHDDDVFNFLCFLKASKVAITPNTFYHYYQRPSSNTHCFSKKYIDDFIAAFTLIKDRLDEINAFEEYENDYFEFFKRCLSFDFDTLNSIEMDTAKKESYFNYFSAKARDHFNAMIADAGIEIMHRKSISRPH